MLHLPYGPGIGPGPFTARKGSLFHETSLLPRHRMAGLFFDLYTYVISPLGRRTQHGPARLGISSENRSTITHPGAPGPGELREYEMDENLKMDLAVIVGMGLLFWLLTRGWPW